MLEVGTNTYVSKDFADEYITSRYKTDSGDQKPMEGNLRRGQRNPLN